MNHWIKYAVPLLCEAAVILLIVYLAFFYTLTSDYPHTVRSGNMDTHAITAGALQAKQKSVSMGSADNWSGTKTIAFATGGIGYVSERQKWTIQSQPPGAEIYTETNPGRSEGKTNSTIEVTKSISSYAILKMNGYEQCVIHMNEYQQCTEKDCSKDESADGSVTFTCTLKKVRINR